MALIAAMTLAVLYFGLMQLLLVDSSRALEEARRFRARLLAATVAENAVELVAQDLRTTPSRTIQETDTQGAMSGKGSGTAGGGPFEIEAAGETSGVIRQRATVRIQGRIEEPSGNFTIEWAIHGY